MIGAHSPSAMGPKEVPWYRLAIVTALVVFDPSAAFVASADRTMSPPRLWPNQVSSWGTCDRKHAQCLMRQFGGYGHGIRQERVVGQADDAPEASLDERVTQRGPHGLGGGVAVYEQHRVAGVALGDIVDAPAHASSQRAEAVEPPFQGPSVPAASTCLFSGRRRGRDTTIRMVSVRPWRALGWV